MRLIILVPSSPPMLKKSVYSTGLVTKDVHLLRNPSSFAYLSTRFLNQKASGSKSLRIRCQNTDFKEKVRLGKSDLQVSRLGIGTLQWGDKSCGYGESYFQSDLQSAFQLLSEGGVNFFDTAEVYGYQNIPNNESSEQLLGKFAENFNELNSPVIVGTKFFTIPWTNFLVGGGFRLGRKSLIDALKASLKRMNKKKIDLYQIHFPFPTFSNQILMEGLKESIDLNLTACVGVSNYNQFQMEEAHSILSKYGIPLVSNQVKYNLLDRSVEKYGLLKACSDLDISLIAYSPLASALLSQKNLNSKNKSSMKYLPLFDLMNSIGQSHGEKSISQVALNYLICKGAIPIPGCKNIKQAKSNLEVLDWKLKEEEIISLEEKVDEINGS